MQIPIDSLWSQVLERLQLELSRPTFETWIKTASAERLENNCLVIRTPNPFARNWLHKYYINTIANAVKDILGYSVEIYITVAQGDEVSTIGERDAAWGLPAANQIAPEPTPQNRVQTADLNPKYIYFPGLWLVLTIAWLMQLH